MTSKSESLKTITDSIKRLDLEICPNVLSALCAINAVCDIRGNSEQNILDLVELAD